MKLVIKIKSAVTEAKKSGFYGTANLDPTNEVSKKKNNRKKKE